VVDSEVLEKPRDQADAARMLRLLSGRSHRVITGVCLISPLLPQSGIDQLQPGVPDPRLPETRNSKLETAFETTEVWMRNLSQEEIQEYVASGEPMDKAGAYAIQGIASRWIWKIVGCYFNVVGLPVPLVYQMLQESSEQTRV